MKKDMNEKKYKKHKYFLIILIVILIIADFIGIFVYADINTYTVRHNHKFKYIGKYYEPVDNFKKLKEYNDYMVTDIDHFYIGPEEWINYCGYNIKTELKNGILINSEEELKNFYNKIMKETLNEYSLHASYSGEKLPTFYFTLSDLVKKINIKSFDNISLIVFYYENETNVCGMKVTDVTIGNDITSINIAISEKEGISSEEGKIGEIINNNSKLLIIKTNKINNKSYINFNFEKYDCIIKEKEMEGELC